MRKSGILMHITSLPSKYGIGTLGKEAYNFADFLSKCGQKLWQMLPIGPTSYGDSPYQSFSSFAGNPLLIDLEMLIEEGLLTEEECDAVDFGDGKVVDYEKQFLGKYDLLKIAFSRFDRDSKFREFCDKEAFWLNDYALFMKLKYENEQKSWYLWDKALVDREPSAIDAAVWSNAEEIEYWKFIQYVFETQYTALKEYVNSLGIEIIGDLPIYTALDSADVWSNPDVFWLDEDKKPVAVGGCPPDCFSKTGQLWGNPLYNWDYLKETGFDWWIKRIKKQYERYDILRIDHFRGFDTYYAIPFEDETAENGEWLIGPRMDLFDAVKKEIGEMKIIAEDLGDLFPSVHELLAETGFPGIKVLQFAFEGYDNGYLTHNHIRNSVVYTGTHDNDTTEGWYAEASKEAVANMKEYLGVSRVQNATKLLIKEAYKSSANTVIIPMQDYLGLGTHARMNTPSTLGGNWQWRLEKTALTSKLAKEIKDLVRVYCR